LALFVVSMTAELFPIRFGLIHCLVRSLILLVVSPGHL